MVNPPSLPGGTTCQRVGSGRRGVHVPWGRGGYDRLVTQVRLAPLLETRQSQVETTTLFGQHVLISLGAVTVADPLEDAFRDQPVEPVAQHVAGDAEACLELLKPRQTEERVTHDQECPALADDLERSCDQTVLALILTL